MKYAIVLFSLMLSTQSFAMMEGSADASILLMTTTFLPLAILADTNERLSVDELMPELQAEILAGPSQYFYLKALAKQLSSDKKYQGNENQALIDIVELVKGHTDL